MGQTIFAKYITTLQIRLQEKAIPKTKAWWEAYMKACDPFFEASRCPPSARYCMNGIRLKVLTKG